MSDQVTVTVNGQTFEPKPIEVTCVACGETGTAGGYHADGFDGFGFVTHEYPNGMAKGCRLFFCPKHYRELVEMAQTVSL